MYDPAPGAGSIGLTLERLKLPAQIHRAVVAHARFCLPEEACGLLATDETGQLRRFTIAPREHFGAIRHAENNGWVIGGSFHSHPESAAFPSARDIDGALDPDWLYLVVGLGNGLPDVRGYRIRGAKVAEVFLQEVR